MKSQKDIKNEKNHVKFEEESSKENDGGSKRNPEESNRRANSAERGKNKDTEDYSEQNAVKKKSGESDKDAVPPKKPKKAERKKPFWVTRAIAEESGREAVLKTTLIESVIHAMFVILVTIYALNIGNSSWYYLTMGLTQQFVDRSFQTLNEMEINFHDIRTAADFWFYVEKHLIGSFFWESTYAEKAYMPSVNANDMNILYENKVLGVPRIRQVKVRNDSCVIHEYFSRLFLSCYDQYSHESQDVSNFGPGNSTAWIYSTAEETKSLSFNGKITSYEGGGFYIDLPKNKNETKELFRTLKDNLWITRGTRAVFIDFTVFNANINVFGVCKLILEFPTSGGVIPSVEFRSIRLKTYSDAYDWFILACEILIYIFVCFFIIEGIRDLAYFKLRYFMLFWTYMDLAIITCCVLNGILSLISSFYTPTAIAAFKRNPDKYGNFEYFGYIHTLQNDVFALNLFFTYMKIFQYLNFNRTMGQLNNTLKKCALDILGFSVMFFIIFFAFAELGYLIFGSQVESFSSFGIAMFTLLRTILGDFDYPEIEKANRILAPIYFLSYIFLVFFVLLNMFLAIINDTYADVKTEIAIAPNEMQMTEYLQRGFFNILRKLGCAGAGKSELKRELNVTIRNIRDALKKCGFSDLEIEMFFARYNIDPVAEVGQNDMEKLLSELEAILSDVAKKEGGMDDYVHINDFVAQQERLEQIDKTIALLVSQVKSLLLKLEKMESVKKIKTT